MSESVASVVTLEQGKAVVRLEWDEPTGPDRCSNELFISSRVCLALSSVVLSGHGIPVEGYCIEMRIGTG